MFAEFNFLNGRRYSDSVVYFGEVLLRIPRLAIPDVSLPQLRFSGLALDYLVHFKAWETWDDFYYGGRPIFRLSARGRGRVRDLNFDGYPGYDNGRWIYDFAGASVDLFESVPEPETVGLAVAGLLALGLLGARRHKTLRHRSLATE